MIRALIVFSLRNPAIVVALSIAIVVAGLFRLRNAAWDVFPEFAPPQITVQTEAPGLSATEVEQFIAVPIESALSGVSELVTLRSSSVPGLCVVTAIFDHGTDVLAARQLISERLNEVNSVLPEVADTPRLMPLTASTSRLLMVGLTSNGTANQESLRTIADWTLRRRIQSVPGVAHVEVFGGDIKQYQILVSPLKLQEYHVTLNDVVTSSSNALGFGGAGFLETANQRLSIRQRTQLADLDDLAAAPVVTRNGVTIPLGQVAAVKIGAEDRFGGTTINGQDGVLLVIHKQPAANTVTVTNAVLSALTELETTLPQGTTLHPLLFRQAAFIERAIGSLGSSLLLGCVLVSFVLIAFLMNARVLLISLTAIPLSLLGAILVLLEFGASLNAMTMGGLAIALGEVVDDAIVDVENVLRRLQQNRCLDQPRPIFDVVLQASLEVRSAVVYASFIVMLVFLPVFSLEGLAGKLFGPLGLAYVIAILVSLAVALTLTPALCLLLLGRSSNVSAGETRLVRVLSRFYRWLLPGFVRHPILTAIASALLLGGSVALVPMLGGEFLPDFRESNFVVFMAGKPDSSLAESERMGKKIAAELLNIPGVKSVAQQIGRANLSEDTWGPNISEVWISLDDHADYDDVLRQMRVILGATPGYAFQTKQFLRERIDEVLTGSTADLLVRVVGNDLDILRQKANEAAILMSQVDGVEDLRVEQMVEVPQLDITLRPQQMTQFGLSAGETNRSIQTLLRGTRVGQVYDSDRIFNLVVRGAPEVRNDPQAIGQLTLTGSQEEPIPLNAIAEIAIEASPNMINREQGRRRLLVTCNAEDRDVEAVMHEIRERLSEHVRLPAGFHFEYAGEFAAKAEAQQRIFLLGSGSLLGILLLLYLDFKSLRLSLLIMLSVPLACVGGIASVWIGGGNVSLGSLVGFVTIFGIAVRNGILLISNYEQAGQQGFAMDLSAVIHCSIERLAPILMTAATTALAIVPLVVAGNLPGHEIEHPMAVVIMGGLISSTLLTLLVLPAMYLRFGRSSTVLSPSADLSHTAARSTHTHSAD